MSDFAAISCQLIEYYNERYVSNNNDCSLKPNFQLMGEASSFTRCSDSSKLVDDENKNLGCSPNEMESPQPLVLVLPFHRVGKALALGVGPPWIHMQLKAILLGKVVTAWTGKQKRVAQVIPIVKRAAIFVPIKQALIRPSFPRSVRYLIAVVPGAITTVIRPWVSQGAVCNISLLHHQHKQHKDAKHGLANAWTADHQNAPNRSIGRQRVHDCVVEIPMHLSDVQPMEQACPKHCLGGLQHSPHFSLKQFVRTDGQSDQLTRTIDGDVFRSLPCITWPHVTFRRHCHNERIFFVLATINQSSGRSQRLPLLRVERRPVREDGEIGRINVGDSDRTLEFHCISECIAVVHLYLHRADARQRPAVLAHELEPFPLISSRNSHETNSTEFEAQVHLQYRSLLRP